MAAPVDLNSAMSEAPVLNSVNGSGNNVLKWTLPQFGWTIEDEDGHRTLFRQGGGPQQYLIINDDSSLHSGAANSMQVSHAITATDVDSTPHMGGSFLHKSLTTANTAARPWRIVGNDQFFIFLINSAGGGIFQVCPFGTGGGFLPGDMYNFVIPQGDATISGNQAVAGLSAPSRGGNSSNAQVAGGIAGVLPVFCSAQSSAPRVSGSSKNGPIAYPATNRIFATPVLLLAENEFKSTLPGLFCPTGDFWANGNFYDIRTPWGMRSMESYSCSSRNTTDSGAGFSILLDTGDWDVYFS